MINRIRQLFTRKKPQQEETKPIDKKHMDINPFLKDITDILKIECPPIQSVACIYEAYNAEYGGVAVQAQMEFHRDELPSDASYNGAYYMDDRDMILIARKFPNVDFETQTLHFKNTTSAEQLFTLAHELRHVWQRKYEPEKYYGKNAVKMEVIKDIAEVDADAFAFAFVFSDKTPFTYEDLPSTLEDSVLQATADDGMRWKRVEKLSKEYGFDSSEKIRAVKENADHDRINQMVALMKLNRMI